MEPHTPRARCFGSGWVLAAADRGSASAGSGQLLTTNLVDWMTLGTNGPFPGTYQFTDTNACSLDRRFYRARVVE